MSLSRGTLTTSEGVDTPCVPNPSVETRARMHSAEPNEPQFVNDPSPSAAADETWRAEVASRVNSYRARRKRKSGENSPALDFGPADEPENPGTQSFAAQGHVSWQAPAPATAAEALAAYTATKPGEPHGHGWPARNAFDTNFYRRLNAESMSQGSSALMGALAAATAPIQELEVECEDAMVEEAHEQAAEDQIVDLELRSNAAGDPCLDRYCISEPESTDIPEPQPEPEPAPMAQGNLIVFRRPLLEPPLAPKPCRDELAEPMHHRPRILEVPEDIMPAAQGSLFPEIRLDADEQETSSHREPEIEVPLPVALISDRFMASLMDMGLVMAAGLLFAGMAWFALPGIPHTKPFFMRLGAVTLLLWAVYQHLFLLYAGRTPGMSMRGIRLSTFDGRTPEWEQRGSRARFMFISFASVMLGFLWAMVDEDMLCWHDRISQTFPTTG